MLKFVFRLLFVGLGVFCAWTFGRDAFAPVWYQFSGTTVEGRISGFLAGRYSPSVQREPTGVRKGKTRARRPVFVYPKSAGGLDSLEARSSTGGFLIFGHFDLNERVTVVFDPKAPENAHIFSFKLLFTAFLIMLFGLFLIWMGVTGKG